MNRTSWYHLYYLFVNDIREDWYEGLSHVAEHTLLIPTDIGVQFIGKGYTCMSHVCLYFGSNALEALQEVDKKLMCGDIITEANVSCAKEQVTEEIVRLRDKTTKYEKLVSFVTESRLEKAVIGNPVEIANIQTGDIVKWLEEKQHCGQIYRFLFRDAHNMILSTPIPQLSTFPKSDGMIHSSQPFDDSFLYTVSPQDIKTVQVYFQIPSLYSKADVIKKAFYEFCIQRAIQYSLGIEIHISDNYFDVDERFVLIEFLWNGKSSVKDIISRIRTAISNISSEELHLYAKEFIDYASFVMPQNESNFEVLNKIKNSIVYSTPQINHEDINSTNFAEFGSFPKEWITSMPLKVVAS